MDSDGGFLLLETKIMLSFTHLCFRVYLKIIDFYMLGNFGIIFGIKQSVAGYSVSHFSYSVFPGLFGKVPQKYHH